VLSPLGITVVQTYTDDKLPFDNDSFDVIIKRHECFDLSEVNRTLSKGGYFITQQVGNENTNEFMQWLNDDFAFDRTRHTIERHNAEFKDLGFIVVKTDEVKYPIKVYDVGAFVFHAKVILWEYPGFSVKTHLDKLFDCQKEIEEKGFLDGTGHRFLIVAKKPM
jgi:SAM-dependent methyltransferase